MNKRNATAQDSQQHSLEDHFQSDITRIKFSSFANKVMVTIVCRCLHYLCLYFLLSNHNLVVLFPIIQGKDYPSAYCKEGDSAPVEFHWTSLTCLEVCYGGMCAAYSPLSWLHGPNTSWESSSEYSRNQLQCLEKSKRSRINLEEETGKQLIALT